MVAILTLALGMGASTAIFSVVDATLLRPLPYPNPDQLVTIEVEVDDRGERYTPTPSMADLRAWQTADDIFRQVAGSGSAFRGRITDGASPERIQVRHFTEGYLPMLGVTPIMGRGFTRDDMNAGAPLVALLGYGYWQSRYSGRADVIGESIRLDDESASIVVLPAWFNAATPLTATTRATANVQPPWQRRVFEARLARRDDPAGAKRLGAHVGADRPPQDRRDAPLISRALKHRQRLSHDDWSSRARSA